MASQSGIEWTDATWNPVRARTLVSGGAGADDARALPAEGGKTGWHCEHVSEGCRNCYAEAMNERLGTKLAFKPGHRGGIDIFLDEKLLTDPLRWKRPRTVFLSSMTDVFADFVSDEMLDRMFAVMALSPQHFFRVLTKRPERMRAYVSEMSTVRSTGRGEALVELARKHHPDPDALCLEGFRWPLPNVGLGVSVEDQASADERIPHLLAPPAVMRFVSAEPLLGAVDLGAFLRGCHECAHECGWRSGDAPAEEKCQWCGATGTDHAEFCKECARQDFTGVCPRCGANTVHHHPDTPCLDEVIVGGESGKGARPMHPDWARALRDQCAEAGVSFFFKQWGEWLPLDEPASEIQEDEELRGVATSLDGQYMRRIGKKAAGAMLDGREHRDVAPQVRAHFERLGRAG